VVDWVADAADFADCCCCCGECGGGEGCSERERGNEEGEDEHLEKIGIVWGSMESGERGHIGTDHYRHGS
jgi:hypothetical protein